MKHDIVVFLGPSLPLTEAKKICPDACYHQPVKCGDIIKVLRLQPQPKIIAIIDGYFEQTASVWHKEILLALAHGVRVVGASSMGALRAAELHSFGMEGVGDIFQHYLNGDLSGDDEVAITHVNGAHDFDSHVTPLVNVRAMLKEAVKEGVLTQNDRACLLNSLADKPYYERFLKREAKNLKLNHLIAWLENNDIDQKQKDVKQLLYYIKQHSDKKNADNIKNSFSNSLSRRLYRTMINQPFDCLYDWLPQNEKLLLQPSQIGIKNHLINFAKLLHVLFDIDKHLATSASQITADSWLQRFIEQCDATDDVEPYLHYYLIYTSEYKPYKSSNQHILKQIKLPRYVAMGLHRLQQHVLDMEWEHTDKGVQNFSDQFRKKMKLHKAEETHTWMKIHDLKKLSQYEDFAMLMSLYNYLVEKGELDLLGVDSSMDFYPWIYAAHRIGTHVLYTQNV